MCWESISPTRVTVLLDYTTMSMTVLPMPFKLMEKIRQLYQTHFPLKMANIFYSILKQVGMHMSLIMPLQKLPYLMLVVHCSDPPCASGFLSPPDLRQKTLEVNINSVSERERQQRLFPDIHFTCNGSITKWIVGAEMKGRGDDQPELQIWRRDRVGGNNYTKTNFSLLTPNETSDPNVHEYYPVIPLEFQEGDILGVYTPDGGDSELALYYQENTGPENHLQSNINPPAPFTFNLAKASNQNDYPLVTVEISTTTALVLVQRTLITGNHYMFIN